MKFTTKILVVLFIVAGCSPQSSRDFILTGKNEFSINIANNADSLIQWAANDLAGNLGEIINNQPEVKQTESVTKGRKKLAVYIACYNDELGTNIPLKVADELRGQWEKFIIMKQDNNLYIIGSDIRGTVYGVFELAERLGISPWKWWADVTPTPQERIKVDIPADGITESPSVQYRGIFINDEDWGLQPWAAKTFEPETGDIGPKTYEKVFQLLLRLKANTIWPAMHSCTQAFYTIPGNREMAEKYHISVGTSHCEPMLCNNLMEWDEKKSGDYNYFENKNNILNYWQKRITATKEGNNIITLGMRGVHDDAMEGDASEEEKVKILGQIINDQREILKNTILKPLDSIPQVIVPYKEVLSLYNKGLKVPDDVTLMWTDDNYGYIRRRSNAEEQAREGGSGVYYHLSYWGRPHDYLWLSTAQPGLIWYEMKRAYADDARKIWIVNVGDIKPAEYDMEFFLDMAWNINEIPVTGIYQHLTNWCQREFGNKGYNQIAKIMDEYYRLAMLRKPEYMGWSQTEPITSVKLSQFNSHANEDEVNRRINAYKQLVQSVERVKKHIPKEKEDAFFELVEYPVRGAALMNYKMLYTQLASEATDTMQKKDFYSLAKNAYDSIQVITATYNTLANGKWDGIMDSRPRKLPVFDMPVLDSLESTSADSVYEPDQQPVFIQGYEYSTAYAPIGYYWTPIKGLGYSNNSLTVFPLKAAVFKEKLPWSEFQFHIKEPGKYTIEVRFLPTHSNKFDDKAILQVNNNDTVSFNLNTKGRSEEWKINVLRNYQAIYLPVEFEKSGNKSLKIYVNQTGIVIDQIAITPENYPEYYEIVDKKQQ